MKVQARRTLVFLIVSAFAVSAASAQIDSARYQVPFAIKWNPTTLLDPANPAFAAGAEFRLNETMCLYTELSYISNGISIYGRSTGIRISGFKAALDYRYIFSRDYYDGERFFFGINVFYKSSTANKEVDFQRFGGLYSELIDVDIKRRIIGGHFLLGVEVFMPEERWRIEGYGGIGLRHKNIEKTNIPEDAEEVAPNIFFSDMMDGVTIPSILLGFRVGFVLK
ncbi:MAG: DUF3575 domain-containing protein [Bacteroidetes bacterium]|nr:DUF3575 domain-containing protein [Bacteroidota bacterium]MBU1719496.1 DUF3575 domain-containing protein [Bacteroidota bacterium]